MYKFKEHQKHYLYNKVSNKNRKRKGVYIGSPKYSIVMKTKKQKL